MIGRLHRRAPVLALAGFFVVVPVAVFDDCVRGEMMDVSDTGQPVDRLQYAKRPMLPDPTATPCPSMPRSLVQIRDYLYRHTNGVLPALHSGLVLITKAGAVVIDPAATCTAGWLRDDIASRFRVPVRYVIYTHGHFDHIAGG